MKVIIRLTKLHDENNASSEYRYIFWGKTYLFIKQMVEGKEKISNFIGTECRQTQDICSSLKVHFPVY